MLELRHLRSLVALAETGTVSRAAERVIPLERLWVNPDCGLKTRGWPETEAALARMVEAARRMRARAATRGHHAA